MTFICHWDGLREKKSGKPCIFHAEIHGFQWKLSQTNPVKLDVEAANSQPAVVSKKFRD